MRRTIATLAGLLAVLLAAASLSACGGNDATANLDKNGKVQACTALKSVSAEVGELSAPNATVGGARTKLADITQKLTDATNPTAGFTATVLTPVTEAIDSASKQLKGVDPATPLSEVPGAADIQTKVPESFDRLTTALGCG